jgi:hypothetical protein
MISYNSTLPFSKSNILLHSTLFMLYTSNQVHIRYTHDNITHSYCSTYYMFYSKLAHYMYVNLTFRH